MKNITLSADEELIEAAQRRAVSERSSLNEQFRLWLAEYAQPKDKLKCHDAVMGELRGKLQVAHKLSRDEMNGR